MLKVRDITTDLVKAKLSRLLRQRIGRGMTYSVKEAAEILDVDQRTMDSYVQGERAPQLDVFLRMFLLPEGGDRILNEMLALVGYQARPTEAGDPDVFRMNAELVSALRDLADMLADGRIDHTEDPIWQAKALDLAMKLIGHVNARRAGRVGE
ncbi:hypothetical protein [Azospirillum canadense]|uniref:hypothetical protein n=1 Tax=Azospirillum canadense TaxID=403962 RepID=UPI002225FD93|nr:hypothetical protein [Azospirillum canadense]MCW2242781.1 putative transcriptional regulator [Azospirillum canadense]